MGQEVYFMYTFVKNDPKGYRTENKTAHKAAPIIDIYDKAISRDTLVPVYSFWGLWGDNPQLATRPSHMPYMDLVEFDLLPNGVPHKIYFALKHSVDDNMYGMCLQSQKFSEDGRYDDLILPSRGILHTHKN